MTDLPAGADRRIEAARAAAEQDLERDLLPFAQSQDVFECVPAFAKFLRALFRAEARELEKIATSKESLDTDLETLLARTIEDGMPDEGLAAGRASGDDKIVLSVDLDMGTGTPRVLERGAEGVWRGATSDPAYAEYGYWELLMPPGVRFRVRRSVFPETNAAVREAVEYELRKEKAYWMARFHERRQPPASAAQSAELSPPPAPRRRGRPAKFAADTMARALASKRAGGSNRDVAQILYATHRPTHQQVKNVPAILKYYGKARKRKKSKS